MSGIVIGGLIGAAAALYFSRGNRAFNLSGMGGIGGALDNLVEKARSKVMAPDKRTYYGGANAQASGANAQPGAPAPAQAAPPASGLAQVESIVKQDPALKTQVNDVLSESRDTSTIR